jgi:hypothetical protein
MRHRIVWRRHSLGVFRLPLPKLVRRHAAFIGAALGVGGMSFKAIALGDGFPNHLKSLEAINVIEVSGKFYYGRHTESPLTI